MFQDQNANEEELVRLIDDALADAFLPRWYRTKYYAIGAWYGEPEHYPVREGRTGQHASGKIPAADRWSLPLPSVVRYV